MTTACCLQEEIGLAQKKYKMAQQKLDENLQKLHKREKSLKEKLETLDKDTKKLEREKDNWNRGLGKRQESEDLQAKINEQLGANKVRIAAKRSWGLWINQFVS